MIAQYHIHETLIQLINSYFNIKKSSKNNPVTMSMDKEIEDYTYYYEENDCRSLVVLENQAKVIEEMFRNDLNELNTFIWVGFGKEIDRQFVNQIERIVKIKIQCFKNVSDLQEYLGKYQEDNQKELWYYMISGARQIGMIKEFLEQVSTQPRKILLLYSSVLVSQNNASLSQDCSNRQKNEQRSASNDNLEEFDGIQQDQMYQKIKNKENLIKYLQAQKFKLHQKELPNFVSVSKGVWKSNMMFRTISAMINKKIPANPQRELIKQMRKLFRKIAEFHPIYANGIEKIEEFLKEISENQITRQRAIYWYTFECPIYRFLNSLLRSAKNPTQAFYIQPYFRQLFFAVESQFKQICQKNAGQDVKAVCYRKGLVSRQELNLLQNSNIGDIIQNLGFLSTSAKKEVTQQYEGNAIFEIHIDFQKLNENEPGFADIKKNSQYYGQQQILFNPLNTFTILQVTKQDKMSLFYIKLAYGEIHIEKQQKEDIQKSQSQVKQREQFLRIMRKIRNQARFQVVCQGNALTHDLQVMAGSKQYWEKYHELAQNAQSYVEIIYALKNLAICQISEGRFIQADELLSKRLKLIKQQYDSLVKKQEEKYSKEQVNFQTQQKKQEKLVHPKLQPSILNYLKRQDAQTFNLLGILYAKSGRIQAAIQPFQISRKITASIEGELNLNNARSLKNIANILEYKGVAQQALKHYLRAIEIYQRVKMQKYPEYASLLHGVGILYLRARNARKSLYYLEESRQISFTILGENSLEYLRTLRAIAKVWMGMGCYQKALRIYEQCRNIKVPVSIRDYPDVEGIQADMAMAYLQSGNAEKALQLHEKCKEQRIASFGLDDKKTAASMSLIAVTHENIGNYQMAEQFYLKSMEILRKIEGNHSKWYNDLLCKNNLNVVEHIVEFLTIFRAKTQIRNIHYPYAPELFKKRMITAKRKIIYIEKQKKKYQNYVDFRMMNL